MGRSGLRGLEIKMLLRLYWEMCCERVNNDGRVLEPKTEGKVP
jgi:hypothetical protein